jgi:hypothetical protein
VKLHSCLASGKQAQGPFCMQVDEFSPRVIQSRPRRMQSSNTRFVFPSTSYLVSSKLCGLLLQEQPRISTHSDIVC